MLEQLSTASFLGHRRGRLLRHYFLISVLSIAGALIASGLLEIYFRYQESMEQLVFQQREAANIAALKIQTFIHDIETAMKAATKYQNAGGQTIAADYDFELKKLFYLAPPITEASAMLSTGSRWRISRALAPFLLTPIKTFHALLLLKKRSTGNPILGQCTLFANPNLT